MDATHFAEILSFHQSVGRPRSFLIDDERHLLTDRPELILKILLAHEFTKVEALFRSGFPCTPEKLGTDFLHKLVAVPEVIRLLLAGGSPSGSSFGCN